MLGHSDLDSPPRSHSHACHSVLRLYGLLEKIASGKEKLDMERMSQVVNRRILEALNSVIIPPQMQVMPWCGSLYPPDICSQLEDRPHDTIAFHVIGEFLYGYTKEDVSKIFESFIYFRRYCTLKLVLFLIRWTPDWIKLASSGNWSPSLSPIGWILWGNTLLAARASL